MQGPVSPFFVHLGRALAAAGHEVRRINLCAGDRLLWRGLPAVNYTGTAEDWPGFVARYMREQAVTDLILLGDRRPLHMAAAAAARAAGIRVFATELGYLRPDWVTLERNGMSTYSHFPADPETIRAIAARAPEVDEGRRFRNAFLRMSVWDVVFTMANVAGARLHPHYRYHAIWHPMAEYAGWIWRLLRWPLLKRQARREISGLLGSGRPFFLFPLQLETDYQIRAHSPYRRQSEAVREVLTSFARHAASTDMMLFKIHPLDNGLIPWRRVIGEIAREQGIAGRIVTVDGGDLPPLLAACRGVITINSTVGTAALAAGKPVKVLGTAVYAIEGLCFLGSLDSFWTKAQPPDAELYRSMVRAMAATIQIRGGFYEEHAMQAAATEAARRLTQLSVNEPLAFVDPPPRLSSSS